MKVSYIAGTFAAIALLLVLAPAVKADNALGLSDSPAGGSSQPAAKKSSWFPFNLFESKSTATAKSAAPAKAKGPSMSDQISASFAKMNADTKRMMTKTATGLGLKKKSVPEPSPFGHVGQSRTWNSRKEKKKPSVFSSLFVKPTPEPPATVGEWLSLPRPGDNSGF